MFADGQKPTHVMRARLSKTRLSFQDSGSGGFELWAELQICHETARNGPDDHGDSWGAEAWKQMDPRFKPRSLV
jgi:hypothetical protein